LLAATSRGQLAVAVTVVLAHVVLGERWTRPQAAGLVTALAAVILVQYRLSP
jgi:drug/metabolite transporter (DMT)-like permease